MSMNEIRAMREKRVKLWEAAKAFVESRKDVSGTLSAEDSATYDQMEADVIRMGKEIERLERQEALDLEFDRPTARPLTDKPAAPEGKAEKTGRASDSYKAAFWRTMQDKAVPHEVLNALQVGTDSEGGYLVPDEYEHTLIESLEEENIFRRFAHIIRTSSGDRKIPIVVSKGTASWIDEEAAYPESDDAFGQTSISAYKLATMIKVSDELLHDSVFDVASYIAREFARRIGAAEEEAFFTGNGTGKPTGLLNTTGGAQVGVTAKSATVLTFDEVMDLFYSLRAPYRRSAVFLTNDATMKALRQLKNGNRFLSPLCGMMWSTTVAGVKLPCFIHSAHSGWLRRIEQPVRDVELAHFRNAVARVQEDVRQQALALEIAVKRLLGLLLGHGEGDNQLRLYAALDAIREDRRAAAIRALRRCGRAFGHQLRTAALADVSLHRFSIAWLKGIRRHRKLHAVIPLVGIHGFNGLYIVAIAA